MRHKFLLIVVILGLIAVGNQRIVHAETSNNDAKSNTSLTNDLITDADTGLQFRKVCGITGNRDVIEWVTGLHMSPNGKFLLHDKHVIPLENRDIIKLVDFPALRSSWSPDGTMIAFYSGGIWIIPMSQETGQPTGAAKKIVDGDYWYQSKVKWSPDSDKIVSHSRDGQLQVFSIKNGARSQITKEGVYRIQGGWSPDGQYIACNQDSESIWIIPVNGGEERKLIETKRKAIPYWSSDGKWIFYQEGSPGYRRELHFIRVSDSFEVNVILPEETGSYISLSPDGKRMLFYRPSYQWADTLKIVSAFGGKPIEPARGRIFAALAHQWSPDGKFILTWGENDDEWTYWVVPLSGDEPYPLQLEVSVQGKLKQESLSPNAMKMLFSSQALQGQKQYWIVPVSVMTGKAMGLVTKIFDNGEAQDFRWSQDGSKLTFLFEKDLWLARADGSGAVPLTGASDRQIVGYRSSPDGSAISWISHSPSTGLSILRIRSLSEDKPRDIVETSKRIGYRWSPNGSHIAYQFYGPKDNATHELFVVSASGGEPRKLIEMKPDDYHTSFDYRWSPSGKNLALLVGRRLLVFQFPDGESQQVGGLLDPLLGRCFGMTWSPDEQSLALIMETKPTSSEGVSGTEIFTVTVPEGRRTELEGESGNNYSVNWSPDGKWISYDSEEFVKTRPEGLLWEVEIDAYLKKMDQNTKR
jgi:Tol biopolymer transport system component